MEALRDPVSILSTNVQFPETCLNRKGAQSCPTATRDVSDTKTNETNGKH